MRHRLSRNRLRQKPAHSRLIQRNLVTSLFLYESIRTTKKRAEVIQPIVDQLITVAKKKDAMNAIRHMNAVFTHKNASRKTMEVLRDRYKNRTSGFTRITPLGSRHGDGAEVVTLAFIDAEVGLSSSSPEKIQKSQRNQKSQKKSSGSSASSGSSISSTSKKS